MRLDHTTGVTNSVIAQAAAMGMDTRLLYEAVIELADEGLLTAHCVNAAADILLTQLGLPAYFFRNITKPALKRVLRTVATNISVEEGQTVLRGEVSEAHFDMDGGVQVRVATPKNRDRMETILNEVMNGYRVEYYFSPSSEYYTYIIHPETPVTRDHIVEGGSPFALAQDPTVPRNTRRRYESFLAKCERSVVPPVEVSRVADTDETRIMFHDDFSRSPLPVIRRMIEGMGLRLNRAYWETYRGSTDRVQSACSLYLAGEPEPEVTARVVSRLHSLLAIHSGDLDDLYMDGHWDFEEYIFAIAAHAFVHTFVYKELATDRSILEGLWSKELRDAFAQRVFDSNRAEYTRRMILVAIRQAPELVKWLYRLFERKFSPRQAEPISPAELERELQALHQRAAIVFDDDRTCFDIFHFMTRIVSDVCKTNFYQPAKRSHAFRLSPSVLDPVVFTAPVYGVFFIVGFYAWATHMRAADIARGGVRLIRVTPGSYENDLDAMALLNYALGPVAQRLKHKDIAESGAKGVIVPRPEFARDGLNAMFDFSDGIMDLVLPSAEVVDHLGKPEMLFFGPDEGTAGFMDAVAYRGRERGYRYWRTLTTGKSFGIPHDTYGVTRDGRVFGLIPRGDAGTELQVDGESVVVTPDTERLYHEIGEAVDTSGMTTMGVLASLRAALEHLKVRESDVNLMMTGGPDGDLGANQIQSFRGRICLLVDGGSILYDPDGLDRVELTKLALARHTLPRLDSLAYPEERIGPRGFRVPRVTGPVRLPDGTKLPDGAYFHRRFLVDPEARRLVAGSNMQAFVPCGGFKDTINGENVRAFLDNFQELRVIVEGANVFFSDTARDSIARESTILQIKDSSANKGGVTCSAIAEVLSMFLLGDRYERVLVEDAATRFRFIGSIFELIANNAAAETRVLLNLREKTGVPLHTLSVSTSEALFALQDQLYGKLEEIAAVEEITAAVIRAYVPPVLLQHLGLKRVLSLLGRPELRAYRDAILTKKIAAMALYRHAGDWEHLMRRVEEDCLGTVREIALGQQ